MQCLQRELCGGYDSRLNSVREERSGGNVMRFAHHLSAGGPEEDNSTAEFTKYGRNRIAEGKLPICAEMCSTKALLAGDGSEVADISCSEAPPTELDLMM